MTPVDQLRTALAASGLTAGRFAREVLLRDPRTVRRWIAGTAPIPKAVSAWLEAQAAERARLLAMAEFGYQLTIGGAKPPISALDSDHEDGPA